MKLVIIVYLLLVFSSTSIVNSQVATVTFIETLYDTSTTIVSTDVTCAVLINVTGVCERRGLKLETPVVLVFDDIDIDVDQQQQTVTPTETIRFQ